MKRTFNPEQLSAAAHLQEAVTIMKDVGMGRQPVHTVTPSIYTIRSYKRKT